ncbi:DUF736 family protein [Campylobacter sp. MOP7]|uniref:DUF736 family protein n=1 Tax=Campylobacter canis TaxID=3378588 RepID=UPI00387EE605
MNVGYFKRMEYVNADGDKIGYTGGMLNFPFLRPLQVAPLKTSKEDKAKNANFPDYQIALQKPKVCEGARQIIGALWHRQSKDGAKNFISGYIESPLIPGYKTYISLFNVGENAKEDMLYDVVWSAPQTRERQDVPPADANLDASSYADDDVIPF